MQISLWNKNIYINPIIHLSEYNLNFISDLNLFRVVKVGVYKISVCCTDLDRFQEKNGFVELDKTLYAYFCVDDKY